MQVQRTINALSHDCEDGMDSKLSLISAKGMETRYYEGCGREGPIRCIFLGEFHPVAGPKIACQFPEDYISKEIFDSISAYIIPKPLIQKCTMTINALGHKIVGYPIRIDNSRYERNVYVFNLCFVCDSWSKTVQYEPVVKKLGEHLTIMEKANRFVSGGSSKLPTLLAHLLHDLNTHRKATIVEILVKWLKVVYSIRAKSSTLQIFIEELCKYLHDRATKAIMDGRVSRMQRPISLAHMAFHDIPTVDSLLLTMPPCDATPPDEMHPELPTPDGVYPPDRDSGTDSPGTSNSTCDDPPSPFRYEHRARTRKVIRKLTNVSKSHSKKREDGYRSSKLGLVFETDYIFIRKKNKKVTTQKKSIVKLRRLGLARQRSGEKYAKTLGTMSKIKTHSGDYLADYFNSACTMHHSGATGIIAPNTNGQKSDPDNKGDPPCRQLRE